MSKTQKGWHQKHAGTITGWCVIVMALILAGTSIYALLQTRELTSPIVAGLFATLYILTVLRVGNEIKSLNKRLTELSGKLK